MGREWFNSRSLLELKTILAKESSIEVTEEAKEAIASILTKTMDSDKNRQLCHECLALLVELSGEKEWLVEVIANAGKDNFVWQSIAAFADQAADFPGKKSPALLDLTLLAKGEDWFTDFCLELPVRMWRVTTKCLKDAECGEDMLVEKLTARFDQKQNNCDQIVWVWKSKLKNKERFITHTNLFVTLRKDVVKHFTKAKAQLIDLIADNDKFLKFLLGDGDPKKIQSFLEHLRTYRRAVAIDEKKMFLRIADLYPDARKSIEQNVAGKKKAELIDMTITSKASYLEYENKLREIQAEIPENKEQIQRAREFGDFSENSELDAAKERQRYLLARQKELTQALQRVSAFDFTLIKVKDEVVQGATVALDVEGENVSYHILGAWDSNPELNMLSSGADLTKVLVGKKKGEALNMPNGKSAVVSNISPLDGKIAEIINKA